MGEKAGLGLSGRVTGTQFELRSCWRLNSTWLPKGEQNQKMRRRQVQGMKRWHGKCEEINLNLKYSGAKVQFYIRGQNNTYGEFCLHLYHIVQTFCRYGFVQPVCFQELFTSFSGDYLDGYLSMIDWVTSLASYAENLNSVKSACWIIALLPYLWFIFFLRNSVHVLITIIDCFIRSQMCFSENWKNGERKESH